MSKLKGLCTTLVSASGVVLMFAAVPLYAQEVQKPATTGSQVPKEIRVTQDRLAKAGFGGLIASGWVKPILFIFLSPVIGRGHREPLQSRSLPPTRRRPWLNSCTT